MDIVEEDFEQYFHISENNNKPVESEHFQSQYEQEFETSFHYMLRIQHPKSILKTNLYEAQKQKCRFKENCLNIIIDGGATSHITNDRKYLTNAKEINNLEVEGILGKSKYNSVVGDMKILLENNIELLLNKVYWIPDQKGTIISESCLLK
eukprot:snap_masked-scaffold_4-processed-gene-21.27-mRNA-1 protein AED:1.00 eAED:1.00 QI:0/-1/0/0/-1/1/1/0/150